VSVTLCPPRVLTIAGVPPFGPDAAEIVGAPPVATSAWNVPSELARKSTVRLWTDLGAILTSAPLASRWRTTTALRVFPAGSSVGSNGIVKLWDALNATVAGENWIAGPTGVKAPVAIGGPGSIETVTEVERAPCLTVRLVNASGPDVTAAYPPIEPITAGFVGPPIGW